MHPSLKAHASALVRFCQAHHIRKLSLFGSQLTGQASASSDVDLLVDFDPAHMPGLIAMAQMEKELSDLLGKKVDLRTTQDLSHHFREQVVRTARVQYAG